MVGLLNLYSSSLLADWRQNDVWHNLSSGNVIQWKKIWNTIYINSECSLFRVVVIATYFWLAVTA